MPDIDIDFGNREDILKLIKHMALQVLQLISILYCKQMHI